MKDSLAPYKAAQEELKKNIIEIPGRAKNNKRIVWYHAFTTLKATDDETPWCSSFMCAMAFLGGFSSTKSAAAKSWLEPHDFLEVIDPKDAKVGDVLIFKRTGGHHVTFLHHTYKIGDKDILCLGGNQSNAVRGSKYPADQLLGVRRFKA